MKPKVKEMTLKNIMQLGLSVMIIVVLLLFAVMYYSYTSKIVNENLQLSLRNFAVSAQYILDGDDHENIISSDSDLFRQQVKILADYKEEVGIKDVYTIVKDSDTSTQLVLAAYDAESTFMQNYIYTETMESAFNGNIAVTSEPYEDAFGEFYSGYAPLFNSKGVQVAIVAVDIDNSEIKALKSEVIYTTIILFGVSLLVSNVLAFLLSRYLSRYFNDLIRNLKRIGEGDLSNIKTETNRIVELNDIGHTISEMADKINRLVSIINNNAKELEVETTHIMKLVTKTNTSAQIISSAVEHMSNVQNHASEFLEDSFDELIIKDKNVNTHIEAYRDLLESVNNTKDDLVNVIQCLKELDLKGVSCESDDAASLEGVIEKLYQNYDVFSENVNTQMISLDQALFKTDKLMDLDEKMTIDLKAISQGNHLILKTMEEQVDAIQGITKEVSRLEDMASELSGNLNQIKIK